MFSWLGGARSPLADFAYAVGEPVGGGEAAGAFPSLWTLHSGHKKADKSPVSVLVFDGSGAREDRLPLARNALKRSKTLRHPSLLHYLDSLEVESTLYIVTPHVVPLTARLAEIGADEQLLSWGLHQILKAIAFLNEDAGLVHGALTVGNIFVDDAGELKLGGFDVLSGVKDEDSALMRHYDLVPWLQKYRPPEVLKQGWSAVRTAPAWAIDVWYFGCLVFELYNGAFQRIEQIKTKGAIPEPLYTVYKDIMKGDPKLRPSPSQLLDRGTVKGGFLANDFVQANLFLESFALKEAYEKDQFFRKLADAVDRFPADFCKYKVLPELVNALEFGSAGSKIIAPLMKIGAMLTAAEYEARVVSAVVKMFAQTDRAMRLSLLENLPNFVDHLSPKLVSQSIFQHVCTGLLDSQPTMREATIKAMVLFAPKLGAKEMDDLMRYLAKTQLDEEPGIRTNTTICLGRLSEFMNDATKKRVLIPAFTRALKDPFPPGRIAGITALQATKDLHAPEDIACKVLPVLCPLLVDYEPSVRQQAFKTISVYLKMMEAAVKEGPAGAEKRALEANGKAEAAATEGGWLSSFTRTLIGGNMAPTSSLSPPTPTASSVPAGPAAASTAGTTAAAASAAASPAALARTPSDGTAPAATPARATPAKPRATASTASDGWNDDNLDDLLGGKSDEWGGTFSDRGAPASPAKQPPARSSGRGRGNDDDGDDDDDEWQPLEVGATAAGAPRAKPILPTSKPATLATPSAPAKAALTPAPALAPAASFAPGPDSDLWESLDMAPISAEDRTRQQEERRQKLEERKQRMEEARKAKAGGAAGKLGAVRKAD